MLGIVNGRLLEPTFCEREVLRHTLAGMHELSLVIAFGEELNVLDVCIVQHWVFEQLSHLGSGTGCDLSRHAIHCQKLQRWYSLKSPTDLGF